MIFSQINKNKFLNIFIFLLMLTLIIISHYSSITSYFTGISEKIEKSSKNSNQIDNNTYVLRELSLLLTQAVNQVGKLSCKLNEKKDDVSLNGGWCSKISGKDSQLHMTDNNLAKKISQYLKGKKVASFGDGPGVYKEIILGYGEVVLFDSYDGAPFAQETTNNKVSFLDLSVPIYHLNQYDWIMCLEVAEHIPAKYESIFINNLVRHSKEGIILSWAKIGQGGHSHVNNKDFADVKLLMETNGFFYDKDDSISLKNAAAFPWLKNNINVYKKKL